MIHRSWRSLKFWKYTYPSLEKKLEEIEASGTVILPRKEDRLKVFDLPFSKVKVVILGQDPYSTKGFAHGLAFSVQPHHQPGVSRYNNTHGHLPPSLRNIFQEYSEDLGYDRPRSGDLREWHKRGVLLLNTALTVEENKPGSHLDLWSKLTYEVLSRLSHRREGLVFMLWGLKAQVFAPLIDQDKHLVLRCGHPSPFSARLFHGNRHFSRACEYLNLKPEFWKLK